MSWGESLGKAWTSVSKYGLRAGLQDAIARWGRNWLRIPQNVLADYGWVLSQHRPATLQAPRSGLLRINWMVQNIGGATGSGGLFNIFRAIQHLEHWGHQHRIYMAETMVGGKVRDKRSTCKRAGAQILFPSSSKDRRIHRRSC